MANGPLGGNMGTPPVPPQPPQVSFETTAQSRGNFNNFLKSIPNTTSMTPIPSMGSSPMMPAPDPMASIDIFNQPVNMRIGGLAGNPLDSYGDYLSQQIDNTQVEPFIQEVQQMASQRFNLGSGGQSINASQPLMEVAEPLPQPSIFQRIPQQYPQDLSRPANLSIFNPEINSFQPFNPPQIQNMMARPAAPFQMQGLGQPMRDKDGILREPMGLRGGSDMFTTLDQQIYDDGFMPGSVQLQGSLPRTFFNGGEVDDSDFGGFSDYGSVDATSDDGFSEDNDVSDYSTDDSGVYTGDDSNNQDVPLPTPRPEILKEAIARAENEVFGGSESDALGFIDKSGGLTDAGQKEYDSAIMANLDLLQDERPADTGTQLANVFDNQGILSASAKNVNPADIVQASFRPGSLNPTFGGNVLDGLDLNTAFGENKGSNPRREEDIRAANQLSDLQPEALPFSVPLAQVSNLGGGLAPRDRVTGDTREDDVIQEITERNRDIAKSLGNRGLSVDVDTITGRPEIAPTVDNLLRLGREAQANKQDAQAASQSLGVGTPLSVQGPPKLPDQVFDIETILPEDDILTTISPEVLSNISREQRVDDANTFRSSIPDEAKIFGGRQVSNLPIGFPDPNINDREDTLGVLPEGLMTKIEELDRRKPTFSGGIMDKFPSFVGSGLNFAENMAKPFIMEDLVSGNFEPIYDSQGRITGSRNPRTGAVQSGMDFNAPMDTGDDNNENPFILKPKAEEEEKEEEDKPPNVIGGGDPITPPTPKSVVVDSPFTSNVSDFVPSTFNTGDINKLIEMLTGVAAPKSMKKGGVAGYAEGGKVMQALDNLLATA